MTDDQQAIRDRILVAALAHVAFDGWTRRTLKAGVKDAGMSPDMALRAFAGGIPDLVDHWADWADRRMLDDLAAQDLAAMRIRDRITAGYGWRLACELRALTAAPIHVAHMPLPALDRDRFEAETPCPAGYDALAGLWAGVLADRDLTLLRQPADTRFGDLMTRRSFARGSVRMADGAAHGDDERFHMNAQYGRRLLEEWFAALSGTAAPGDEI